MHLLADMARTGHRRTMTVGCLSRLHQYTGGPSSQTASGA
jgi:hypothetical protein